MVVCRNEMLLWWAFAFLTYAVAESSYRRVARLAVITCTDGAVSFSIVAALASAPEGACSAFTLSVGVLCGLWGVCRFRWLGVLSFVVIFVTLVGDCGGCAVRSPDPWSVVLLFVGAGVARRVPCVFVCVVFGCVLCGRLVPFVLAPSVCGFFELA